jgi:hypothetical protein
VLDDLEVAGAELEGRIARLVVVEGLELESRKFAGLEPGLLDPTGRHLSVLRVQTRTGRTSKGYMTLDRMRS